MIKINIGCGKRNFGDDWVNVDGADFPHIKHHDVAKLPYDDNSVDLIYSSHLIAYFNRQEIVPILNEWKRVLKPEGMLRLATPDFQAMTMLYWTGKYTLDSFLGPLYGKMPMGDQTIYHKTTYDFDSLSKLLHEAGFKTVKKYDWKQTEHADFDDHSQAFLPKMDKQNGTLISLNVEAIK